MTMRRIVLIRRRARALANAYRKDARKNGYYENMGNDHIQAFEEFADHGYGLGYAERQEYYRIKDELCHIVSTPVENDRMRTVNGTTYYKWI